MTSLSLAEIIRDTLPNIIQWRRQDFETGRLKPQLFFGGLDPQPPNLSLFFPVPPYSLSVPLYSLP